MVVSGLGPHWLSGDGYFFSILITFGVIGSYCGAGLVGWRIVDKYFHPSVKAFLRRYLQLSAITFILLIIITYTPFSIIAGIFWSLVAPYCVIKALPEKPIKTKSKRTPA